MPIEQIPGQTPAQLADRVDVTDMVSRFQSAPGSDTPPPATPAPPKAPENAPETPAAAPPSPPQEPVATPTPPEAPKAPETPKTAVPDVKAATAPKAPDGPKPGSKEYNFAQLSKVRDELEAKYKTAQKQIEELNAKVALAAAQPAPPPEEYEALKAKAAELENIVSRKALEEKPSFKAAFDQKIDSLVKETAEGIDAEAAPRITAILNMPAGKERDNAVKEAIAELDDFSRTLVVTNYAEKRRLEKARAEELAKNKEVLKQLETYEAQQAAEKTKQAIAQRMTFTDLQLREAANVWPEFKRTEDAEHNKLVDETHGMVRHWTENFDKLTPVDAAKLAVYAAKGIRANEQLAMQAAMIAKLQEELKQLASASPKLDSPGATTPAKQSFSTDEMVKRWNEGPR